MRIMLMTDLEGVAGVNNAPQWCEVNSHFYATACRLLTREVNAAVEGFFGAGAKYVQVADGHGAGAIDIELLDARVEYARGWPEQPWPFGLDASFNGVAWVGQHAKASTEYAHLCHTQSFRYIDLSLNGVSIGEFGQLAMCGAELGVPAFFGAGDLAFTKEAEALSPGIVTCAIKRGVTPGIGVGHAQTNTEVCFPVSSEIALLGTFEGHEGILGVNEEYVAELNRRTFRLAQRYVYCSRSNFEVMMNNGRVGMWSELAEQNLRG